MRLVFDNSEQRIKFFEELMSKNGVPSLRALSDKLKINSKSMYDYYRGRLSIPDKIYSRLSLKLFDRYHFIEDNFGKKKGGLAAYKKNKFSFEEGRQKAIYVSKNRPPLFDINLSLDYDLAYFIGLFIGDGFTNTYQRYYIIQFTGDKRTEDVFYRDYFSNVVKKLFNLIPKIRHNKLGNGLRFNLYSRDLFNLLTKRFKIKAGRKSHTVLVPEEILGSSKDIKSAFLRGIYDAEGCVFIDKRKTYKIPYVRIELHMCNLSLLRQLLSLLEELGIKSTLGTSKNNLRVTIYTEEMVKRFIKEVGFSNPKQLDKLRSVGLVV